MGKNLGHMEAEVLANTSDKEVGAVKGNIKPMELELLCMNDMGAIKGLHMWTNEWCARKVTSKWVSHLTR